MAKKARDRNRHKKWEQSRSDAGQENQGETQEKSELNQHFELALEHGMADCAHDFARALGTRPKNLRAWKSGRDKPDNKVKRAVITEAEKRGWVAPPPAQENP